MGNHLHSCENRYFIAFGFIFLTYFFWMDLMLYYHLQNRKPGLQINASQKAPHFYTPFSDMTMKLIMCDSPNHYIWTPLAQLSVDVLHLTKLFPGLTANMITFAHFCVAIIAAKFISYDRLCMRRIGVLLFEFRTFLDALDGVIARERKNKRYLMESEHGTWGYIWDGSADIFGSLILMLAAFNYLYNKFHRISIHEGGYKLLESGNGNLENKTTISTKVIWSKLFSIAILMTFSLSFWDRYITKYHFFLENIYATPNQQILENEVLKSSSMWIIIWFWRLCNAHAFLEICMIAIFVDKIWEFLCWIQYIGFFVISLLILVSEIHLRNTIQFIGPIIPT
ncbi:unnamed protein product [Gordionus sp. m RMFG-2023]|uniref:ceramide phosphoethanolamine synthase-like n=1 Tax=Gordionus sp. m RMFG-2023 TaxID=3053472 RepID=UPI0030DE83FB